MTKHFFLAIILFVFSSQLACGQDHLLDEGISLELAQHRKALISNLRYCLRFSIPKDRNEAVRGSETIWLDLSQPSDVIIDFNESEDKVLDVSCHKRYANKDSLRECRWRFVNGHIVIPKEFTVSGKNGFDISFIAGNQGLNRRDGYVYTLFVPDRAHTVFPCFDQPNLKARFTLDLDVPESWIVAQNGIQSKTDSHHYVLDTPIPTYLFAFAAGEFNYEQFDADGYCIGAFHRETDSARVAQLPEIMHQVAFSLRWQEEFTGVKYPFPKYDLVILPGFQFGGMEHVGATFYNDNTIFLPANPTPDEQLRRTELISHETSHMWFGDAVTMDWFNDVWTKEVFANYFAAEITAPLFPELDHELNWLRTYQGAAISQDRTEGRTSIRQPLDNMKNAGLIYNNIIYNKAPVMMRKMVALMGKEAFQRGIRKYVEKYKYDNATWDDLIEILDTETDADLKSFSKKWVDTPMWPSRKAGCYKDALDTQYYGFTELSEAQVDSLLSDFPKTGAQSIAAMMTLYENYLNKRIGAQKFYDFMLTVAAGENPLSCSTALRYISEPLRELQSGATDERLICLEKPLYGLYQTHPLSSVRKQALRTLISMAISKEMTDILYSVWEKAEEPLLSVNDCMTMAYELSVRMPHKAENIRKVQRSRITNPDRLAQFDFVVRAVNPSEEVRDTVFASLSVPENRRIEPWTLSLLYYLNHPLRERESVKYIRPALEILPDIQRTGDIFFPANWCSNLLSGHRSTEADAEVESFLKDNTHMNPLLRNKILQARYYLRRSRK